MATINSDLGIFLSQTRQPGFIPANQGAVTQAFLAGVADKRQQQALAAEQQQAAELAQQRSVMRGQFTQMMERANQAPNLSQKLAVFSDPAYSHLITDKTFGPAMNQLVGQLGKQFEWEKQGAHAKDLASLYDEGFLTSLNPTESEKAQARQQRARSRVRSLYASILTDPPEGWENWIQPNGNLDNGALGAAWTRSAADAGYDVSNLQIFPNGTFSVNLKKKDAGEERSTRSKLPISVQNHLIELENKVDTAKQDFRAAQRETNESAGAGSSVEDLATKRQELLDAMELLRLFRGRQGLDGGDPQDAAPNRIPEQDRGIILFKYRKDGTEDN